MKRTINILVMVLMCALLASCVSFGTFSASKDSYNANGVGLITQHRPIEYAKADKERAKADYIRAQAEWTRAQAKGVKSGTGAVPGIATSEIMPGYYRVAFENRCGRSVKILSREFAGTIIRNGGMTEFKWLPGGAYQVTFEFIGDHGHRVEWTRHAMIDGEEPVITIKNENNR